MHTSMHIYAMFHQLNIRFSMNTFDELLHVNLLKLSFIYELQIEHAGNKLPYCSVYLVAKINLCISTHVPVLV